MTINYSLKDAEKVPIIKNWLEEKISSLYRLPHMDSNSHVEQ